MVEIRQWLPRQGAKMVRQGFENNLASRLEREIRMGQGSVAIEKADKDAIRLVRGVTSMIGAADQSS